MKLAILSDFHFGFSRFRGTEGDCYRQAEEAIQKACELADVLLIPGDIFDSRTPPLDVIEKAIKAFSIAQEKKWAAKVEGAGREGMAPVVVIHGTHERRSRDFTNPVHILEAAGLAIDAHKKPVIIELNGSGSKEGGKDGGSVERVAVHGLGGVPEYLAKAAIEAIQKEGFYKPVEGAFNVFMFHQSLREMLPDDEAMSLEDLPDGFDLHICGHMHRNVVRQAGNTKLIIPGSTVLTQMKKDEESPKGFYLYDTKTKKEEFVEISSRPFYYREVKLKDASLADVGRSCEAAVKEVVEKMKAGGSEKGGRKAATMKPMIRLKITGTLAKGLSNDNVALDLSSVEGLAFIEVAKELEGMESEKAALIRDIRAEKVSVKEMGMAMLRKRLEENGAKIKDVEALFELLAEAKNSDDAMEKMTGEESGRS